MLYLGKPAAEKPPATDWPAVYQQLAENSHHPLLKAFYHRGIVTAETPLAEVPLLAMDFETTGLNPGQDGIVSIGLLPMTLSRISCSAAKHWILKPRFELRQESVVIHRITHSDIAAAPDLLSILPELLQLMAGRVMIVHHRGVEQNFLNAALKLRLQEGICFPVIDTMELESRLHRVKPVGFWASLFGRQQVSVRLADSRSRYNLPAYRPHHAVTDALACAELLQAQVADRFSPETPVSELWI